ncbi:MAG: peptidoglycan DD-metalloendopeptidase family protein, partial [Anaerolineaceae bacterium]|nr:peptidoglycan DD-metalloendopeptidase family protein [Anaerolineaceae bacterium]
MRFRLPLFLILIVILLVSSGSYASLSRAAAPESPPVPPEVTVARAPGLPPDSGALVQAVQETITTRKDIAGFQINQIAIERIQYAADESVALIYLDALDPETSEPIAREPGLAIAHRVTPDAQSKSLPSGWQVTMQADATWADELRALPAGLLDDDLRQRFLSDSVSAQSTAGLTLGGYLLPWAGGQTKSLTWSVGHTSCNPISDCEFAFDFADGSMFPLLAAKGGTVFGFRYDVPNNNRSGTNYLVLQDTSTNPISYQIYYHMAQESLPLALRTKGMPVRQGQYIGNVDNTGFSSGSHLHFMVTTSAYGLWGPSVDITFRDVPINWDAATQGGRPRLPKEAAWYGGEGQEKYTSANFGAIPPEGAITAPDNWLDLTSPSVHVEGWGSDDLGVTKAQVVVNYGIGWVTAGAPVTFSPAQKKVTFAIDADLCASNVPDGPLSLSARVWDVEGNQTLQSLGVRQVFKHAGCGPVKLSRLCTPAATQVALYAQPYYLGACQVFEIGDYMNDLALGSVGEDRAASIMVGSAVKATLFRDANLRGRATTFTQTDSNLGDHPIGSGTVSSMEVEYNSAIPSTLSIQALPHLTADDSLTFAFVNTGGAEKFQAQLSGPVTDSYEGLNPYWPVGNLPAGDYTLTAKGFSSANGTDYFSQPALMNFTISARENLPAAASFPYAADFESGAPGWTTSGAWSLTQAPGRGDPPALTAAWRFNADGICTDGALCAGDLTSPPIPLPAGAPAYLRFDYQWHGEIPTPYWDQRRVQIATSTAPGGPYSAFADLYALSLDPPDTWLTSPAMSGNKILDLSAYQGKYVRIRFNYNTLDGTGNQASTWTIDNVAVDTTPVSGGALALDGNYNATPEGSIEIKPDETKEGVISPGGDMDYYHFDAQKGITYQVDVTTKWPGSTSTLDPMAALIDWEQVSYLAENDDIQPGVNTDARVSFTAQQTNTFYIRVKAWNHPVGGDNQAYHITLSQPVDSTPPAITMQVPNTNGFVPSNPFTLTATASDNAPTGVKGVDFYYHRNDWEGGNWIKLGEGEQDAHEPSVWRLAVNPGALPESSGLAFWARATDWAFNYAGAVFWNAVNDHTAPLSALLPLPGSLNGNTFSLTTSASDVVSGVERCEIQVKVDTGEWQAWAPPAGNGCQIWFTGEFGHRYAFRTRAVDRAGNQEAFPEQAEASIQLVDPGQGDALEDDNSQDKAREMAVDGGAQMHDFYGSGDQDWGWFQAQVGKQYILWTQPQGGPG